jgi:hypothetical protein
MKARVFSGVHAGIYLFVYLLVFKIRVYQLLYQDIDQSNLHMLIRIDCQQPHNLRTPISLFSNTSLNTGASVNFNIHERVTVAH